MTRKDVCELDPNKAQQITQFASCLSPSSGRPWETCTFSFQLLWPNTSPAFPLPITTVSAQPAMAELSLPSTCPSAVPPHLSCSPKLPRSCPAASWDPQPCWLLKISSKSSNLTCIWVMGYLRARAVNSPDLLVTGLLSQTSAKQDWSAATIQRRTIDYISIKQSWVPDLHKTG